MEITIAPNRYQRILNTALISGLFDSVTGYFRHDGLYIEDQQQPGLGVKAFFPNHFFITYKTDAEGKEEKVCLTNTLLKPLSFHEAFEQEKITVLTKEKKIFYLAKDKEGKDKEFWKDDLEDITEKPFARDVPLGDKGFVPTHVEPLVQVLCEVKQLKVHEAERYKFVCSPESIILEVVDPGIFRRVLKLSKQPKLGDFKVSVSGKHLETIVGLYTGEIWITLFNGAVALSQRLKEMYLTYMLSPKIE